jgi:hypothetical protein
MFIGVTAVEHPDVDEWVMEQARAEAGRIGVQLVEYLGREDSLPEPRPADLHCHVFSAARVEP